MSAARPSVPPAAKRAKRSASSKAENGKAGGDDKSSSASSSGSSSSSSEDEKEDAFAMNKIEIDEKESLTVVVLLSEENCQRWVVMPSRVWDENLERSHMHGHDEEFTERLLVIEQALPDWASGSEDENVVPEEFVARSRGGVKLARDYA